MTEKIQYNSEVSRRYSKALFKLASDKSAEKKIYEEISSLLNFITNNEKFNHIFCSPLLSSKNQLSIVNSLFSDKDKKKIRVSSEVFSFFKVMANNGRLKALLGALYSFQNLVESMHEEVNVSLTSAVPISEGVLAKLKNILSKRTKKKLNITSSVDKNIIGGIILRSGSNLIDASIRNKILKLNSITKGVN